MPRMTPGTLNGVVQMGGTSGSQPIANALVTLYETGTAVAETPPVETNDIGQFFFPAVGGGSGSVFYVTAKLQSGVTLAAIVGPDFPEAIAVNELTTVAVAYAFAQFWSGGKIEGDAFGILLAAGMYENLANRITGLASDTLTQPPNGDQTNSLQSMYALANIVAAAVWQRPGAHDGLIAATTLPSGHVPGDTISALVNSVLHPQNHVDPIYALTKKFERYTPALSSVPDAWTLAVKVNNTGSGDHPFSGAGGLVFDSQGFAWITNNTVQGTPNSSTFMVVLQPNGRAANGRDNTPMSPITDGGLLGGGFGIAIDQGGNIWASNFGWGDNKPSTESGGNGSVSEFDSKGNAISGALGYQGGPCRVQGIAVDSQNNIWLASFGTDQIFVFLNGVVGNPSPSASAEAGPFGLAVADDDSVWMTCSGGMFSHSPSFINKYQLVSNQPELIFSRSLGHSLKGVSLDSQGNAWVASGGDNAVYLLNPDGELLGKYSGGGVDNPWSATIDGDDNVWVANFGPMVHGSDYIRGGISKLAGYKADPGKVGYNTGDPISPSTGYTLPSGGAEVTLSNGDPLYGPGRPSSYAPLQRMTQLVIDQAGNVWALNNWKPAFTPDALHNPGGDGIVIFVGLAKPPKQK